MPDTFLAALVGGDLLDRAAGRDRARLFFEHVRRARPARCLVLAFDQEPVLVPLALSRAHAHEMPAAVEFLALEIEDEVTLGVGLVRIAVRDPASPIPDHDGTAAILAFRDRALEGVVFDRMIFDADSKTLFVRIEARAARHRPALHHAVELEPQIVVQPPRRVLLNDVAMAAWGPAAAARFRCHVELALFPVGFEGQDALTHPIAPFAPPNTSKARRHTVAPVAIRMTWIALPITSAGRFSPLRPRGIQKLFDSLLIRGTWCEKATLVKKPSFEGWRCPEHGPICRVLKP